MKTILAIYLILISSVTLYGQNEKYVGTYFGIAESDSAYGHKIGDKVQMKVKLTLHPDFTYEITWNLDFNAWCGFDSIWYNTGKWMVSRDVIYLTLDKNELYEQTGKKDYPISTMNQDGLNHITKKDEKRIAKFKQKHPGFKHWLKFENNALRFNAEWDCIEEIWHDKIITRI